MYNERRISKMVVENYDHTITQELPYNDSTIDDWLQMFKTAMVGITYSEEVVVEGIADYLIELGWDCVSPREKAEAEAQETEAEDKVKWLRDRGWFVEPQLGLVHDSKRNIINKFLDFFGWAPEDVIEVLTDEKAIHSDTEPAKGSEYVKDYPAYLDTPL